MEFCSNTAGREQDIIDLFTETFAASESAEEGALVGALAKSLLDSTPANDLLVCCAQADSTLIGCIVFSRMTYDQDSRNVFILSPVAVRTDRQGKGIGQDLLNHGLDALRSKTIDIALTYGDPNYYAKVGFQQITEEIAKAPHKLNQPYGWLAQSLTDQKLHPLAGTPKCVPALDNPSLW